MTEQPPEQGRDEAQEAFEAYALALGQVAYTWNYLQDQSGQLFVVVTGMDDRIALSVWYSSDNDRVQRNMLKAAIFASNKDRWLPRFQTARDDMLWLVQCADALSDQRNNAIHAPTTMVTMRAGREMVASISAYLNGHPRARRLWGKRLLTEFSWCAETADSLSAFTRQATLALRGGPMPWPDKPALPIRRQKTAPQAQPRQPRTKSRQRLSRSSQA